MAEPNPDDPLMADIVSNTYFFHSQLLCYPYQTFDTTWTLMALFVLGNNWYEYKYVTIEVLQTGHWNN